MNDGGIPSTGAQRRPWAVLAAAFGLLLAHHLTALAAAHSFHPLAAGYSDRELLAPGGDLALELMLLHEAPLRAALQSAGLWLLAGRIPAFVAAYFLLQAAFAWAWPGPLSPRPAGAKPLHSALAPLAVLLTSLLSAALTASALFGFAQLRRALLRAEVSQPSALLFGAALVLFLLWALLEVWLDLLRLALAGARLRPWQAVRSAGRAWRQGVLPLLIARTLLAAVTLGATLGGAMLLSVMTRGERGAQWASGWTLDLGLLGAFCLRAAWLSWASAHLPAAASAGPASERDLNAPGVDGLGPSEATARSSGPPAGEGASPPLSRGSSAAALPASAPDEPGGPSPDPGA